VTRWWAASLGDFAADENDAHITKAEPVGDNLETVADGSEIVVSPNDRRI
jgi:hypothetical protein